MRNILFTVLLWSSVGVYAQEVRLTVKAGAYPRTNTLVSYKADQVLPAGKAWKLEEVTGGKKAAVPVQMDDAGVLTWVLRGTTASGEQRAYRLYAGKVAAHGRMHAEVSSAGISLKQNQQPILNYNTATVEPPAATDTVYRRSGFIHPLWAPNGVVLTTIYPKSGHAHHMGIWSPWTHTRFEGRVTDFWNVQKKEGKVFYAGTESVTDGDIWCGFRVKQEQVAYPAPGKSEVAIQETYSVRAYEATANGTRRLWDVRNDFSSPADSGITLLQYRYGGGFALRTTPYFTSKTSQVLTSEGNTRKDADSTRARWVMITGTAPEGEAGLLIMNAPDNFDSPQPLRVWPENMDGGELMLNYSPTKMKTWQLVHGNVYTLKYRVMVYSGRLTTAEAEAAWRDYAFPPEVVVSGH
ncbi:PmoA family protein [Chitinophaga sp. sic0106]|uniref:DUF6807 domain-containing protein n=1 Tax=Chitinophaga sp. sic0106 TaxID=2854785 RepID=UPI001C48F855|nr:PmoA family protein [Chitinophaga sp. sic0106]MBV7532266.1 PmoA family protein [Chitinophaga sp. sic0106]